MKNLFLRLLNSTSMKSCTLAFSFLFAITTQAAMPVSSQIKRAYQLTDQGKTTSALSVLGKIKTSDNDLKSQVALLKGRIEFNRGNYLNSYNAYKQVSKKSDIWLPSVEERAWTLIYLGKANEALADSHTLMSPLFRTVVGPEAFFVSAFAAYQVCDFTRVFKVIDQFKKISRKKIANLESGLQTKRDKKSQWQLEHYSEVIQHLSLIEADAIQRMYLDQSLQGQRGSAGPEQKIGKYDLQFPYEENDVWIDEIDQLQVNAKNCPQPVRKVVSK